jgi:hypothetical protein
MSALTVKLHMQGKTYKIPAVGSLLEIEQYVKSKFVTAAPFSLSYVDEDGDIIVLHLPQMPNFRKLHVARELRIWRSRSVYV